MSASAWNHIVRTNRRAVYERAAVSGMPDVNPYNYLAAAASGALGNVAQLATGDMGKVSDAANAQLAQMQNQLAAQQKQLEAQKKLLIRRPVPPAVQPLMNKPKESDAVQTAKAALPWAAGGLLALAAAKVLLL